MNHFIESFLWVVAEHIWLNWVPQIDCCKANWVWCLILTESHHFLNNLLWENNIAFAQLDAFLADFKQIELQICSNPLFKHVLAENAVEEGSENRCGGRRNYREKRLKQMVVNILQSLPEPFCTILDWLLWFLCWLSSLNLIFSTCLIQPSSFDFPTDFYLIEGIQFLCLVSFLAELLLLDWIWENDGFQDSRGEFSDWATDDVEHEFKRFEASYSNWLDWFAEVFENEGEQIISNCHQESIGVFFIHVGLLVWEFAKLKVSWGTLALWSLAHLSSFKEGL